MSVHQQKWLLIVHSVIWGGILPLSVIFAPFAAFLFDDPSAGGVILWAFAFLWFFSPVMIVTSLFGVWVAKKKQNRKWRRFFMRLPYQYILLLLLVGLFVFE